MVLDEENDPKRLRLPEIPLVNSDNAALIETFFLRQQQRNLFLGCKCKDQEMSFSFLSDAYPGYKSENSGPKLFEDFGVVGNKNNKVSYPGDSDLLLQEPTPQEPKQKANSVPAAFDSSSDYFKILASEWVEEKPNATEHFEGATNKNKTGCMDVALHLDNCKECRSRLEQIFRKLLKNPVENERELKVHKKEPLTWLLDIVLLFCLGIFIVFVLDSFVRLGRYFTKR